MSIPEKTRTMIAKLLGMLGSEHDGEALNAARLLKRRMESEGVSFGDLSNHVMGGGVTTVVHEYRREEPRQWRQPEYHKYRDTDDSESRARAVLTVMDGEKPRGGSPAERDFLNDAVSGYWDRPSRRQIEWLDALYDRWCIQPRPKKPKPYGGPKRKPGKRAGPVPDDMLDELGLTDKPRSRTRSAGPMPDASDEPQATQSAPGPIPEDILDGAGLGERGTYTGPEATQSKRYQRDRFSNLDFDDEIPF